MIPIYLKNMAGEMIPMEVDPSASLLEIAQQASAMDPEPFPPGRTKVMRMDGEEKEEKPWEEDDILVVMVSSPHERILNPYVIDLVRTLQTHKDTLLVHQHQVKAFRGKIASAHKKGRETHALETQLDQVMDIVEKMTKEVAIMESNLIALRQEARRNIQEDLRTIYSSSIRTYSALVYVKWGEKIIPVRTQMRYDPICLRLCLLDQMGYEYRRRDSDRIFFLDENGKDIPISLSWTQMYRTVEEIPILRAVVQETPSERETRIAELQWILTWRRLRTDLEDEAIWNLYSTWDGFWKLLNRRTMIHHFVHEHPHLFVAK